jgi:hypothetical protein
LPVGRPRKLEEDEEEEAEEDEEEGCRACADVAGVLAGAV